MIELGFQDKEGELTVKIALALQGQTPAGVLGEGVKHVVKKADASVDGNLLRLAGLGGVAVAVLEEASVGVRGKVTAIEVESQLDLGLVGVAGHGGPASRGSRCAGHCR